MNKTTMADIQAAAKAFSKDVRQLRNLKDSYADAVEKVAKVYAEEMKELAKKAAESKQLLELMVQESEHLFIKPKTLIIDDVKVGFMKQKGKIEIPNEEATIKILRADFPSIALAAIKVEESLVKDVLSGLTGVELKKLGVTITADTDNMVVKLTDTALEKVINAIMKEQQEICA